MAGNRTHYTMSMYIIFTRNLAWQPGNLATWQPGNLDYWPVVAVHTGKIWSTLMLQTVFFID
ncbi:hypothetical protein BM221_004114 [Beauveria bassiana]|uniref:Uncharacterized protein n=1 Tax=Beauveria bassiana TaxID=176275 RepID=A0A2N6NQB4_BEABA|nr:hypothetical protein BM221_004114 [Beauveria bassiana]